MERQALVDFRNLLLLKKDGDLGLEVGNSTCLAFGSSSLLALLHI